MSSLQRIMALTSMLTSVSSLSVTRGAASVHFQDDDSFTIGTANLNYGLQCNFNRRNLRKYVKNCSPHERMPEYVFTQETSFVKQKPGKNPDFYANAGKIKCYANDSSSYHYINDQSKHGDVSSLGAVGPKNEFDGKFSIFDPNSDGSMGNKYRFALVYPLMLKGKQLTVANIHLEGGMSEDPNFKTGTRKAYMQSLINEYEPDVILGDFNGNPDGQFSRKILNRKYYTRDEPKKFLSYLERLVGKKPDFNTNAFLAWREEPFRVLEENGYERVSTTSNSEYEPTSIYGDCVDHIYIRKDSGLEIVSSWKADFFKKEEGCANKDISDHHGLFVELNFKNFRTKRMIANLGTAESE